MTTLWLNRNYRIMKILSEVMKITWFMKIEWKFAKTDRWNTDGSSTRIGPYSSGYMDAYLFGNNRLCWCVGTAIFGLCPRCSRPYALTLTSVNGGRHRTRHCASLCPHGTGHGWDPYFTPSMPVTWVTYPVGNDHEYHWGRGARMASWNDSCTHHVALQRTTARGNPTWF